MVSKIVVLVLGLIALAASQVEAADALSEARDDLLDNIVGGEPETASTTAELLQSLYDDKAFPRNERILQCLQKVQRCWEDVISGKVERSLCVATARDCRTLVLTTSGAALPIQIEEHAARDIVLYKTLDMCGEGFDVSKLHEAAATDTNLALALQYMEQKGIQFLSYCYLHFYAEKGSKTIGFHPIRFNAGEFLGSPSRDIPSYEVTIDEAMGQITLGHYVK